MLSFAGRFRPEYRGYFRARLSAAHFSSARLAYRRRKPMGMIGHLMASAGRSPATFLKQLRGSLARHRAVE